MLHAECQAGGGEERGSRDVGVTGPASQELLNETCHAYPDPGPHGLLQGPP